jgi:hypothetical protein
MGLKIGIDRNLTIDLRARWPRGSVVFPSLFPGFRSFRDSAVLQAHSVAARESLG